MQWIIYRKIVNFCSWCFDCNLVDLFLSMRVKLTSLSIKNLKRFREGNHHRIKHLINGGCLGVLLYQK